MRPLFSIIVPTYNSEKNISECLRSVLIQNFDTSAYEIIVVDDCSTDKTLAVCKKIQKEYSHIKILNNKKNKGVSFSRNVAINKASGLYAIFLDSDDRLINNSLNQIKVILGKKKVNLLLSLNLKYEKKKIINKFLKKSNNFETDNKKLIFKILNSNFSYKAHCWNYILSINFIKSNNIFFKNFRVYEDQIFTLQALLLSKKIILHKNSFHIHVERFNSLSRSMNFATLLDSLKVINKLCKFLIENKLLKEEKIFLYSRIDFMIKIFNTNLLICERKKFKTIKVYIKKNITNLSLLNKKFLIKMNYKNIAKNINNLLFKKFNKKFTKIYIFGLGGYGRILFHILNNKNIDIEAFLDNNKNFNNKKYLGKKILNPNLLKKFNIAYLKNILVLISMDDKIISSQIKKQLKLIGLNDTNIKMLNWRKIF